MYYVWKQRLTLSVVTYDIWNVISCIPRCNLISAFYGEFPILVASYLPMREFPTCNSFSSAVSTSLHFFSGVIREIPFFHMQFLLLYIPVWSRGFSYYSMTVLMNIFAPICPLRKCGTVDLKIDLW